MKSKGKIKARAECDVLQQLSRFYVLKLKLPAFTGKVARIPSVLTREFLESNLDEIQADHYIFFKVHEGIGKHKQYRAGRTLFVLNIPAGITESILCELFSKIGKVESVLWCKEHKLARCKGISVSKVGSSAHVVFQDQVAIKSQEKFLFSAKNYPGELRVLEDMGVDSWIKEYQGKEVNCEEVIRSASEYMKKFDQEEERKESEFRESLAETEDGFTRVQTKRRVVIRELTDEERAKLKRNELSDFYKFQIQGAKRSKYDELRMKFSRDKQKIAELKSAGYFKPV